MAKRFAFEVISYQVNDSFVIEAEKIVKMIFLDIHKQTYKSSRDLLKNSRDVKALSSLIKSRFNIENEISGDLISLSSMAVIPYFNINKSFEEMTGFSFPFMNGYLNASKKFEKISAERKASLISSNGKKGFVNTRAARVGGYLSNLKNYFIFDFYEMYNEGFSPSNTVAVMLHEIGHAFSGLEYHYLMETSNMTLRQMLIEINKNDVEKAVYIFNSKASPEDMINIKDTKSLTRYDMSFKLFTKYFKIVNSQMIDSKYNETSFENLADSFATRFGMGKELAEGLEKLYKNHGAKYSKGDATMLSVLDGMYFLFFITIMAQLIMSGAVLIAAFLMVVNVSSSGISSKDMTYDELKDRYQRIRNTMVNQLKETIFLNKELTQTTLEGIDEIDRFIDTTFKVFSTSDFFSNTIMSKDRRTKYYYELQRDLEDLSNNKLFTQAARLSLI